MKKLIALIVVMALFVLSGCGANQSTKNTEDTTAVTEPTAAPQTQAAEEFKPKNTVGNSTSNYCNDGTATMYGDEIYFLGKDSGKRGIYIFNNTTGIPEILAETHAQDLSTVDGDVYYLNEGSIYKLAKGGRPELFKEDGSITDMCATDSWIYYIKKDEKGLGKIYKLMYSGSGETMVTPKSRVTDDIKTLTFAENMLYFSDAQGIGSISLDGVDKQYFITGYAVSDYAVYGEYLYFVYNGQIFRIKQGGTSEKVQCNAVNVQRINIVGDVMYVVSDAGIGTMPTNGGNVSPISPEKPTTICVYGNYIFGNKGLYFYRMRTDGTDYVTFE